MPRNTSHSEMNSKAPLIIKSNSGLANRLRILFFHFKFYKSIEMVWPVNRYCNGRFLDHFKHINGIRFVDRPCGPLHKFDGRITSNADYSQLLLRDEVLQQVAERLVLLSDGFTAVHIRRTDHSRLARHRRRFSPDENFYEFIEKTDGPLFVACDCPETQNRFSRRYANRIVGQSEFEFPKALRQTSLRTSILDIYTCANASRFLGSGHSTFSLLICRLHEKLMATCSGSSLENPRFGPEATSRIAKQK